MPNVTQRDRARSLRANLTDAERRLWRQLRQRQLEGSRFRRQMPLGPYIADFVCLERRLIVEVDGGQHQEQSEYDASRDQWLRGQGFRVLRFWNNELLGNMEGVLSRIADELRPPTPALPRKGGGSEEAVELAAKIQENFEELGA